MAEEDSLARLEQIVASLVKVAQSSNERLNALAELSRGHDERLNLLSEVAARWDERMDELAAAQANSEAKLAALADAQIKTESVVAALGEQMKELASQHGHADRRLDALINIVREMREGNPPQQG